jgi:hypothetical protein
MNQTGIQFVCKIEANMTPQERQLLESLAARIINTPPPQKDPEADQMIQERIGSRPDALYILAQTVLIQEMALNQANGRLHDLQERLNAQQGQPAQEHTSFLGRLFGGDSRPQYVAPPPQYAPPQQYAAPPYAPAYAPPYQNQGAPSFLRSAATTATGVAAGALAFEGIESLLHGGFGGNYGGGYGGGNETIVNNYYEEPRGGDSDTQSAGFLGDQADSGSDTSDADYSDDSGDSSSFDDSSS